MANNVKAGRPYLPNLEPIIAAGIDPKTGLPIKLANGLDCNLKSGIKTLLRILDEANAVNRFTWYNLPCNITSQELERMLYYKGQLCFFYSEPLDEFYFMPYALASDSDTGTGIDYYGRYRVVHPIPFTNGTTAEDMVMYKKQLDYLSTVKLNVLYDVPLEPVDPYKSCVLVHDYTKQLSQTSIPRQILQEPVLDVMSDCLPFMRTALQNSTGVLGMKVNSQDEQSNVKAANDSINRAALVGQRYIPIIGNIDFQELAGNDTAKAEEFLLAMQSLDNFRLSLYGLDNGGLFQKKSHVLEAEQAMNAGHVKSVLEDGLAIRQHMCDIANAIWGIGISCEISESAIAMDMNMDGIAGDDFDQSGSEPGQQMEVPADDVE